MTFQDHLEAILDLLISPTWKEISIGPESLGEWVASRLGEPQPAPEPASMRLELGSDLVNLTLLMRDRMMSITRHIWLEMGLPSTVDVLGDPTLAPDSYAIYLHDRRIAGGQIYPGHVLAIGPLEKLKSLEGDLTVDPTYGMPGRWIKPEQQGPAERLGCIVFDPISVMATQVTDCIRAHAGELLSLERVDESLSHFSRSHPKLVELARELLPLPQVAQVLRQLVEERVSIRDLELILNTLLDAPPDPLAAVRLALAPQIVQDYVDNKGQLKAIEISPGLEHRLSSMDLADTHSFLVTLDQQVTAVQEQGLQPVLVCSAPLRYPLRCMLRSTHPQLVILAWNEISPPCVVHTLSCIDVHAW